MRSTHFCPKEGQTDFHADPPLVKPGRHGSDSDHFAYRHRPRQPTLRSSPALRLGPECPCSLPRPSDRWSFASAPRVARWPGCRRPPTLLSRRLSRPSALTPAASDIFRSFCRWPVTGSASGAYYFKLYNDALWCLGDVGSCGRGSALFLATLWELCRQKKPEMFCRFDRQA